ncbi:MAG: dihydrodipicolinate synthase family protein [Bryobacterales bacterium]|nr:dihydrodipicolinate synthase family protein [Bryobacterales bacterium]
MRTAQIQGIIPPIVTPFRADGSIDEELHRREVRYMVETAGVHGLAVGGSTGEGHTLSTEECRDLVAWTMEEVDGRIPVIAGVIADSTREAVERGNALKDLRPTALQVTPVHYLFRPDDESMLRFFGEIAGRVGLPLIVYNVVPWAYLSVPLLVRLFREVDGAIGVKQSASDVKALADLLHYAGDAGIGDRVRIITAVDALLYPSFQLGAHAAIAAILSAIPEACVALWEAVQAGDDDTARRLHDQLLEVWNALEAPNLPANVRTAMRILGREGGYPRAPMPTSSPEQAERIRRAIEAMKTATWAVLAD